MGEIGEKVFKDGSVIDFREKMLIYGLCQTTNEEIHTSLQCSFRSSAPKFTESHCHHRHSDFFFSSVVVYKFIFHVTLTKQMSVDLHNNKAFNML